MAHTHYERGDKTSWVIYIYMGWIVFGELAEISEERLESAIVWVECSKEEEGEGDGMAY